jgi:hypothetical protein
MEQSQYCHFPSRAGEGAEAVVMPAGNRDHIGCFADQVKLTQDLVQDLDEAVKEVNLLGEHGEESSHKITELEALCKRLREDAQRLREERTTLEGMIQSRDELILEMAEEYGLNRMVENDDDEDETTTMKGTPSHPQHRCPLPCLRRSSKKKTPWRMVYMSWMIWMTWAIWMRIQMKATLTWKNGFSKMGVVIEIESSSLSLKFRVKNKFLGSV